MGRIHVLITAFVFHFCAGTLLAADWQINGGSCVPEDPAIQGNLYQVVTGGGRVKYKGTHLQRLKFVCPITTLSGTVTKKLRIYYQDPDGGSASYQVTGRLRQFRKENGAYTTVSTVVSSNAGSWQFSESPNLTLDFDKHYFWLEVEIARTQTSLTVEFNGAELR